MSLVNPIALNVALELPVNRLPLLFALAVLAVLAWLVWERHTAQLRAADDNSRLSRQLEDREASLDACEATLARSEAALTRQRAEHEAREHALDQRYRRQIEDLTLAVAQAQVECLIGRTDAELPPGDAREGLQAALGALREEILASRARLGEASAQIAASEEERARLSAALEQAGSERTILERRLTRAVEQRDQHHWYAFHAQTVLNICGAEGRSSRGCADEVTRALDAQMQPWLTCLRGGHATPQVLTLSADQAAPPPAEPLRARRREVVWLQLCDPTLPEHQPEAR